MAFSHVKTNSSLDRWSLFEAPKKMLCYTASNLEYLFFSMRGYVSQLFIQACYVHWLFEATAHFKAIPLRVNGWDHMGLRWFRMANPAESVISSRRHQFGVWNRAPGEPDSLGDSSQEQRAWGSAHTHLDKMGISQSASNTWSKMRTREGGKKHDRQLKKKVQRESKRWGHVKYHSCSIRQAFVQHTMNLRNACNLFFFYRG